MAIAIQADHTLYSGYSLRIAGASDIKDKLGREDGHKTIARMGRWSTDIAEIYQRETAADMLIASSSMADSTGIEVEALLPGYIQPAISWNRFTRR